MKKSSVLFAAIFLATFFTAAASGWADIGQASATLVEGAVGLPVSLVKLVGGLVWLVGEVIILPFSLF